MNRCHWVFLCCLSSRALVYGADLKPAIEVRVEVTEVDQVRAARLGVKWLDTISLTEKAPHGIVAVGSVQRLSPLHADLNLLIEEGAAELLANPNLIADSGATATFHAGGEIPYITATGLGVTNVEFKPYGVHLAIAPEALSTGQVRMKVEASVSSPDQTNGVILSGNTVPGLLERKVSSRVTVDSGETITLAGLVQTHKEKTEAGVPILRRIPLLGALFRWRKTNFRRTTVIVFVTPRIMNNL